MSYTPHPGDYITFRCHQVLGKPGKRVAMFKGDIAQILRVHGKKWWSAIVLRLPNGQKVSAKRGYLLDCLQDPHPLQALAGVAE